MGRRVKGGGGRKTTGREVKRGRGDKNKRAAARQALLFSLHKGEEGLIFFLIPIGKLLLMNKNSYITSYSPE
jgi:hypothetical protein